ncbi:hypothetical protein LCGC14_1296960 [marine sediment metagenome]|uniref:Alpha 1,4-glycosyltransferase domain-containing protein n=1 Tax=marine sediment metagenome TaxID=412755 RepID=A0A0F9KR06_9ZZZZ
MSSKPYIWIYWDNYPGKSTPPYIELCWESIRLHCNRDFNVVMVNSANVRKYLPNIRDDFFDMVQINNKSNYLRYKLLCEYGGIWLDSDLIILKSLFPLLNLLTDDIDLVATASPEYKYGEPECGIIVSKPKGAVISRAIQIFESKMDAKPKGHIFQWGTMGPAILRAAVVEQKYHHLDHRLIMPIGWQHANKFDRIDVIEKYVTKKTLGVMLYHEMFRRANSQIISMSRKALMDSKWLVGRIFREALS